MTTDQPTSAAGSNTGMRSEIQVKWNKFTTQEVAALRNNDDLLAQVQTKYALDRVQAQRDVELLFGLRDLGRRQRLAAGIVQHDGVLRADVADDVLRDQLEMHLAMQLADVNRMCGIVIIDPVVHCRAIRQKRGFRGMEPVVT